MSKTPFTRGKTLLKLDHINLTYGSNVILRDLNAEIKHLKREDEVVTGQIVCFLGPSGIGKTQTSRIIAALNKPTSGGVYLREEVSHLDPAVPAGVQYEGLGSVSRGDVCMVPQNYPMFEFATVAGNLVISGIQGHLSKDQINVKATGLIETFGLREHLGKYPKDLSGGTRQRVAIARQLMCVGNYIVMDEPFSGLDPINKKLAMSAITKLASLDTYNVIVVVTHDIASGMAIADTVWMMGLEKGSPGARLIKEYDLASMGLAWQPGIEDDLEFKALVSEVSSQFKFLKP